MIELDIQETLSPISPEVVSWFPIPKPGQVNSEARIRLERILRIWVAGFNITFPYLNPVTNFRLILSLDNLLNSSISSKIFSGTKDRGKPMWSFLF